MEVVVSQSRESRILDAAGELLLVFGYRKVTIDDVARLAGVGKGTVYLHWASKLELFATVLIRDVARIVVDQLAALRADPAEIRLHRTMRGLFLLVVHHPLARAFYTGDTELLGAVPAAPREFREPRSGRIYQETPQTRQAAASSCGRVLYADCTE
jgi:AcrR family transcriptional regulator